MVECVHHPAFENRDSSGNVCEGIAIVAHVEFTRVRAKLRIIPGRGKDSRQILTQTFGLDDCLSI